MDARTQKYQFKGVKQDWLLQKFNLFLLGCVAFGEFKNGILILDLPDFVGQRNVKSEIGFVTFVTFRKRAQFAWQRLKKWRVFYSLTNYAIISCRILWSAVRIAMIEDIKQIKEEAR